MENALRDKSFSFAIEVVLLEQEMKKIHEYVISKQLIRSGTSIGALIREAQYAESTSDFKHKLTIALKEANETEYWLNIILNTYPQLKEKTVILKQHCKELIAMLVSATNTLKKKLAKNRKLLAASL